MSAPANSISADCNIAEVNETDPYSPEPIEEFGASMTIERVCAVLRDNTAALCGSNIRDFSADS
jgi:hypothetical protein